MGHRVVTNRLIEAILNGSQDLTAHGPEGINGLTLANGIMLSSFTHRTVEVPFDANEYEGILQDLIRNSKFAKPVVQGAQLNMKESFNV